MTKEVLKTNDYLCQACATKKIGGKIPAIKKTSMGTCPECRRFKSLAKLEDYRKAKLWKM